jgi:hypothetical protein
LRISIEAPSPKVLAELGSLADKFTVSRPSSPASRETRQTVQRLLDVSTGPPPAPTGQVRLSGPEPRVVRPSGPEPQRPERLSGPEPRRPLRLFERPRLATSLEELRIRTSALNDLTSPLHEMAARQSMGCGARARTGHECGKRVLDYGLCQNHLRRAQLGRLVIWDSTGKPVQLPS